MRLCLIGLAACSGPAGQEDCGSRVLDGRVPPQLSTGQEAVDCNSEVDGRVPSQFSTIQEAVDTLPENATICLSPGTYTESFRIQDQTVTILGSAGAVFDVSSRTQSMIEVVGEASHLELRGVGVTGTFDPVRTNLEGGFLNVESGSATLRDVQFDDIAIRSAATPLAAEPTVTGGLVYANEATIILEDVKVDSVQIDASTGPPLTITGGLFSFLDSDATMRRTAVTNVSLDVAGAPDVLRGTVLYAYGNRGGVLEDVEVTDVSLTADSDGSLFVENVVNWSDNVERPTAVLGLNVTRTNVSVTSTNVYVWALVSLFAQSVTDVVVHEASVTATPSAFGSVGPCLGIDAVEMRHIYVVGNRLFATSKESVAGPSLAISRGDATWLDVRDNHVVGDRVPSAGVGLHRGVALRNATVAGNRAGGPETSLVLGAGVYAQSVSWERTTLLENVDVVANEARAPEVGASGVYIGPGGSIIRNSSVALNTTSEALGVPQVWVQYPEEEWLVEYTNVYGSQPLYGSIPNQTSTAGNLSVDPVYTDVSASAPTDFDLTLGPMSPLIDAGDPALLDPDGSRSNIGAFGGPGGGACQRE